MPSDLHSHPVSATGSAQGRGLAIAGIVFSAAAVIGAYRIVRLLTAAFPEGDKGHASPEATALAEAQRPELSIWLGLGFIALILISIALWKKRNRETWFFGCGLILALAWMPSFFPYGLYLAIAFLLKWRGFMASRPVQAAHAEP